MQPMLMHSSKKVNIIGTDHLPDKIFKYQQDQMGLSYKTPLIQHDRMHFYELFQAQIEIFWINTLLSFDDCFKECSGRLQTEFKITNFI